MNDVEKFIETNNLHDTEDIDSLLELASLVRELIGSRQYEEINEVLNYTISQGFYEGFSWAAGILQEELEKDECGLESFECIIGKSIPDFDQFIQILQVDFRPSDLGYETVCDNNGEVESFFNNITYKTGFENIYLASSENFDTKDNDYIQYKLIFTRK